MLGSGGISAILASGRPRVIGKRRALPEDGPRADDHVASGADTGAQERSVDDGTLSDVAALPQDAVADASPRVHAHARSKHRVGPHLGLRRHAAARTDIEGRPQLRPRLDDRALVDPAPVDAPSLDADGKASAQDVAV